MRAIVLLVICLSLVMCGCHSTVPRSASVPAPSKAPDQTIRDNSYSLLADLLGDEKNVSKLLLVKQDSRELNRLIKDISAAADRASTQLKKFGEQDASLILNRMNLPPGEAATRKAIASTKTKELLGNSGDNFERSLLLTQIQALNYASHLASVAAEHDANPQRAVWARAFSQESKTLYSECVELVSRRPHGK